MSDETMIGPSLIFYVLLVALLSTIAVITRRRLRETRHRRHHESHRHRTLVPSIRWRGRREWPD